MARKLKATRTVEAPAIFAEDVAAGRAEAPTSVRRGRKPKAVAGNAGGAQASAVDPGQSEAPVRGRPSGKAKALPDTTAAFPLEDDAEMPFEPEAEPVLAGDAVPTNGARDQDTIAAGDEDIEHGAIAGEPALKPAQPTFNRAPRSEPAARWDRVTDTVRFDWPEIERIVSQEGPNQGMAKLLAAARAEGAGSRWPF